MSRLYASPLRVYLCLAVLAIAGLFSGFRLPVSLFPNSSKPVVDLELSYGSATGEEFLGSYGSALETQLRAISTDDLQVEKVSASYGQDRVRYEVEFKWGSPSLAALKEVETVANAYAARLPDESRDSINVWTRNDNGGFLAVSYYSSSRSLDAVYDIVEPVLGPRLARVQDASQAELWNPSQTEVRVELRPERMSSLGLFPRDVSRAIATSLEGRSGGSVTVGPRQLRVQMPRAVKALGDFDRILVPTPSGAVVHLGDIARVDLGPRVSDSKSFKTSGAPSLILFAQPRAGGNVKRMSEEILEIVRRAQQDLPKDIQYKVLVDPSEFIRNSIHNVFHEVAIGALLAVAVLFLFIGSFRNTVTAAIEIPLSMVLAFILMRLSGMNLNLISLGGLALSAGMNVDASVVVMENIFRRFEELPVGTPLSFERKLSMIAEAVAEVRFPVIASTIVSLVVFVPLAFTSDLSYAILGDLAKTVVFSHGFSAFVALLLVPTVRLHLLSRATVTEKPAHSPIEPWIRALEDGYGSLLGRFIASPRLKWAAFAGITAALALLFALVLPRLPKEVLGTPDTDWMMLGVNTQGNTLLNQMEGQVEEIEARLLGKFGSRIQYTFTQVMGPNRSIIMARLKQKRDMHEVWKGLEVEFSNTPFLKFWVAPWNPAELPIPDPPDLKVAVRGGTLAERADAAHQIEVLLDENHVFPRVWSEPDAGRQETIVLRPRLAQWDALRKSGSQVLPEDLADLARVATVGRKTGSIDLGSKRLDVYLRYPDGALRTAEDVSALAIGLNSKVVPFKALADVGVEEVPPTIYREDGRELFTVIGRKKQGDDRSQVDAATARSGELLERWKKSARTGALVQLEDAQADLNEALKQLATAVGLSILLIFLTLVVQFGSFANAVLVLVAVPLGLIGVLLSLFVFRSTLSLNSALGVILLNGIAVANSIILVDFMKKLVEQGMDPAQAAVEAGKKRLRPILITSLTTILGMLPIAIGMGEGGRILQPLGIAVSGGLWVSMGLTLFVVPALQVRYEAWRSRRNPTNSVLQPIAGDAAVDPDPVAQVASDEDTDGSKEVFENDLLKIGRPGIRTDDVGILVSGAIVADEVAAEAHAEGALSRDQVSKRAPIHHGAPSDTRAPQQGRQETLQ